MFYALATDRNEWRRGRLGGDTERGTEGLRVDHAVLGRRRGRGQQDVVETPPPVTKIIAEAWQVEERQARLPKMDSITQPNLSTSHPSMPTVMA